jgi:hypothetical protein
MMGTDKHLSVVFLTAAVAPGPRSAPFGAARVASALKAEPSIARRSNLRIVEGRPDEKAAALADRVLAAEPDIVGLSLYLWNSRLLVEAAAMIKATSPRAIIVAGGPDASADPGRLSAKPFIDIVVAGEGEEAMADIVIAALDGRQFPGPLIRAPLLDVASLASPWLDGTLDAGAWGGAALELMRGCPYHCAFCFESKGAARLRRFPLEIVAKEIERFESEGVDEVFVLDPTFNADAKRMAEAVRIFRDRGPSLRYFVELRAELLTPRQAELLSTIDCTVQIGLQSSDPAVLKLVDRDFEPESFARKVGLLDAAGIIYGLDLIYGLPGDTLAGFRKSLDYALDLGPNHLDVFRLAVLPGTSLADRAGAMGIEHDAEAPYLVRSTPRFGAADMNEAERLADAADLLYNKGRAVMWFRPVLELARTRPSSFISSFADFAASSLHGRASMAHRAIEKLQLDFLADLFARKPPAGKAASARAALDLVRASGAWTRALAEGESAEMELGWGPEDLLDYAAADIAGFAAESPASTCRWSCSPGPEGPVFRKGGGKRPGNPQRYASGSRPSR